MAYSDLVLDHYHRPRNAGAFPKDEPGVGSGLAGNPGCGEVVRLQIKVQGGQIVDARFKAFGSGGGIASSSYATELVKGRSLEEALAVSHAEIVRALDLPPVKVHSAVLAEQAIKAAVEDYRRKWLAIEGERR